MFCNLLILTFNQFLHNSVISYRPAIHTDLIGIILIFYGNLVHFRFSKYLGNIPIFFQTKFSPPMRSTGSLHKRINTGDIIMKYRYWFFIIYIIYQSLTAPNIDSAEFICLHNRFSIFTSRLPTKDYSYFIF